MASELRKRFEDYLVVNRLAQKTQDAYLNAVAGLSKHYNQTPERLTDEQIQQYLVYLIRHRKLSWSSCNVNFSGLHCFYKKFLNRPQTEFSIPPRPRQKKLPEILSRQEVLKLIDAAHDERHRALLMITYGSGLRVSETVHLKPHHIESDRMLVRIEQAKGRKDRYTLLSQKALDELRIYWKVRRPEKWLFYGRDKAQPMDVTTAQKIYYCTKKAAGITRGKGIHTLRHCFATHLLEQGIDIYLIKRFLGHLSIQTTLGYLHLLPDRLAEVKSPLDTLL
ncbi:MAG TPA: site-specific integrase [Methylomicrobium sp.]|nr:site-specific integrase [Methylomicrobium sp.]